MTSQEVKWTSLSPRTWGLSQASAAVRSSPDVMSAQLENSWWTGVIGLSTWYRLHDDAMFLLWCTLTTHVMPELWLQKKNDAVTEHTNTHTHIHLWSDSESITSLIKIHLSLKLFQYFSLLGSRGEDSRSASSHSPDPEPAERVQIVESELRLANRLTAGVYLVFVWSFTVEFWAAVVHDGPPIIQHHPGTTREELEPGLELSGPAEHKNLSLDL